MNSRLTAVFLAGSALLLTGCGIGTADIESVVRGEAETVSSASSQGDVDENTAIAQCGILGGLLNGDEPITVDNYDEVQETLQALAADGVGAVKPTAQHILDEIGGEEFSEAEGTETIEEFKDFCMDYTVD
ncbi:hypothetical protein [Arthrobacter sp. MDT1-65]